LAWSRGRLGENANRGHALAWSRPPAFNDIVDYMGAIPSSVATPLRVSEGTAVTNSSGFISDVTGVTVPETLLFHGLTIVNQQLINVQVRGGWNGLSPRMSACDPGACLSRDLRVRSRRSGKACTARLLSARRI